MIVKSLQNYRKSKERNLDWDLSDFSKRKKQLSDLISQAVYTHNPRMKQMHKNYYPKARDQLIKNLLQDIEAFSTLNTFKEIIIWIHKNLPKGIADLGIYDTALRLGLYKGISPDHIYMGVGSRIGAKQLFGKKGFSQIIQSLDGMINYIPKQYFPKELQVLDTYHIESFLCIYRKDLILK